MARLGPTKTILQPNSKATMLSHPIVLLSKAKLRSSHSISA